MRQHSSVHAPLHAPLCPAPAACCPQRPRALAAALSAGPSAPHALSGREGAVCPAPKTLHMLHALRTSPPTLLGPTPPHKPPRVHGTSRTNASPDDADTPSEHPPHALPHSPAPRPRGRLSRPWRPRMLCRRPGASHGLQHIATSTASARVRGRAPRPRRPRASHHPAHAGVTAPRGVLSSNPWAPNQDSLPTQGRNPLSASQHCKVSAWRLTGGVGWWGGARGKARAGAHSTGRRCARHADLAQPGPPASRSRRGGPYQLFPQSTPQNRCHSPHFGPRAARTTPNFAAA
jgi:hypothetical protein